MFLKELPNRERSRERLGLALPVHPNQILKGVLSEPVFARPLSLSRCVRVAVLVRHDRIPHVFPEFRGKDDANRIVVRAFSAIGTSLSGFDGQAGGAAFNTAAGRLWAIQVARTAIFPIALFMTARNKPIAKIVKKRGRGRPPKEDAASETLSVALSKGLIAELDTYCEREGKTRSTAIRHFVREGLKGKRDGR